MRGFYMDLLKSLLGEFGVDSTEPLGKHVGVLGGVGLSEFRRLVRRTPRNVLEEANLRLPDDMLDVVGDSPTHIAVVPVGQVPRHVVEFVFRTIRVVFGTGSRLLRARAHWPVSLRKHEGYIYEHADEMLACLVESGLRRRHPHVIALTDLRLSSPSVPDQWLHGYASLISRVSVVSIDMIQPKIEDPDSFKNLFKAVVHELGHTFALDHCGDPGCIMMSAPQGGIASLPETFCKRCRLLLKLYGAMSWIGSPPIAIPSTKNSNYTTQCGMIG